MSTANPAATTGSRRMPEKRRAIARAASTVFGREGYTRASVDAIASEAGVSKRTIYNHFGDKEKLFLSVALETAGELTEIIAGLADRHLHKIVDLEADLTAFAVDRAKAVLAAGEHYALGRTIRAEAGNIPPDVLAAWLAAGPLASQRDLADHLTRLASQHLLALDDPDLAATHFTLLTFSGAADQSFYGAVPISDAALRATVTTGVQAFLRLYPRP
ncbi:MULTISPECIES: TetR/AcrR family transcriptional regulator [unclassified Streptomyces]|uniref:TetR/AcrR family transcriptional regulator n=1 Tax=unclassified Streptomyces TaxID=2593676 RepID=UPI0005F99A82|nr:MULTISPECIES: TetR/AcrR family transcriptional regulator [unclassified Streptomyces]KJY37996.1 TetR family transcriptional regulator [Streptomyces sp. NRRL S-495]KOV39220.1 TetR family transcriptional regulator [Streptomyces sp. XY431]